MLLIYEFTISEVIELVRTRDHIEDITEGLFLTLTYIALCMKYGNFLARRDEVSMLLNCFRCKTCQPKNSEERMILVKYERKGSQFFLKAASKFHFQNSKTNSLQRHDPILLVVQVNLSQLDIFLIFFLEKEIPRQ